MAAAAVVIRSGVVKTKPNEPLAPKTSATAREMERATALIKDQQVQLEVARQATILATQQLQQLLTQAGEAGRSLKTMTDRAEGLNARIEGAHAAHMLEHNAANAARTSDIAKGAALGFCVTPVVCGLGVIVGAVSAPAACTAAVVVKLTGVSLLTAAGGAVVAARENTARADAALHAAGLVAPLPPA